MGMLAMAEHHANSEIIEPLPEGEWITSGLSQAQTGPDRQSAG